MNIDSISSLISKIETDFNSADKIYVKQVRGEPELSLELPEDVDFVGTIYPIDMLHPDAFTSITSNSSNYLNSRPIVIYSKGSQLYDFSIPLDFQINTPYTGRPFIHTKWDCFTLLKDFYKKELNINLPDVSYFDEWWAKGEDFYMQTSGAAGFYPTLSLKKYDVIAMRLNSHVFNHAAIYLGDNKILHHMGGKFSCIEEIRPAYLNMLFGYFRHKDTV
jgi:hypothetical protein